MRIRLLLILVVAGVGGAALYRLWPAAEIQSGPSYVDMHVHVAGVGAGDSGCFISTSMRDGYKFKFYLWAFGVSVEDLEREGDAVVLRKLSAGVAKSKRISKAVVLALDGVVTKDGELDRERTQVYVPNEYLAQESARYDNLVFGASINPYRRDAIERLERAKAQGAVLVKWIPGIMAIDPADPYLVPFYDRLQDLGLPLLSHAGQEQSFAHSNDALGDPHRLELPLQRGVTVIAAHIASTGIIDGEDNFDRLLPMFARYQNLYADISSLTQLNRLGYLSRAVERPALHPRLVYGSDWPLQFSPLVSPWYQWRHLTPSQAKAIAALHNPWDRDVALKEAMGVPAHVFQRSASLLGIAL